MNIGQLRQGDVLLDPVDVAMPAGVKDQGEVVLAWGEVTGHAHRVIAAPGTQVYEWEVEGQRYVRVEGDSPGYLKHEDHDPTPVAVVEPNVTYRIVPQQQWDLTGRWRRVMD